MEFNVVRFGFKSYSEIELSVTENMVITMKQYNSLWYSRLVGNHSEVESLSLGLFGVTYLRANLSIKLACYINNVKTVVKN